MLDPHPQFTSDVIYGLGWFYLVVFLMNVCWTLRSVKADGHFRTPELLGNQDVPVAGIWAIYSGVLMMVALAHLLYGGDPASFLIYLPEFVKEFADGQIGDAKWGPILFFSGSIFLFVTVVLLREWLVKPTVAWVILNVSMVSLALSMTDYDFRQIVGKADNVPIVGMLFIVGFFTWLYFARAVENDHRTAEGRPLVEQENNEKVLVWPDLVYSELICMVVLTVGLIAWGILLQAPLEEAGNRAATPNPSKAPWYFLGLQEMLVYFDPWLAGVVLPSMILVGLMALPYIDFNPKGNGYYTFNDRKFAVLTFMFGFMPLWVAMIILGTFLRGPNWNIFGFFEFWDVHKLAVLSNVNLSEYVWVYSPFGSGLPTVDPNASFVVQAWSILCREFVGIFLILGYFMLLPPLMAATCFRNFFHQMGFIRFMVFANLLLWMATLPIKMVLRWTFSLKYIVAIPEWFFNI